MKQFALGLLACLPAFAAGSVNQTIGPLGPPPTSGPDTRVYLMQLLWTGDSVNGTVPATLINISQFPQLQGMRVISAEIQPNTPSPTSGYSLTLVDQNGVDLLAGVGSNLSATAASSTTTILSPPLVAAPTFNVAGNSVASARGQLLVYFSPVSQITPNSGPGLTSTNTFTGGNTFTGNTLVKNLNLRLYADQFPGVDACAKINAAILALPNVSPIGGIVDATGFSGYQACASNPFAGVTFGFFQLYLGSATFLTQVQWLMPAALSVQMFGMARGDGIVQSKGTTIEACTAGLGTICNSTTFPSSTPLVFVKGSQGQWLRDLNIDCEVVTGCIALQADAIAESTIFEMIKLVNFPNIGLNILSTNGTLFTQNYTFRNIEMYPANATTASTVGLKIAGSGTQTGPYEVSNVNVIGSSGAGSCGTKLLNGFQIDGIASGTFNNLHTECNTNGFNIGSVSNASNLTINNLNGGATSTINNAVISNTSGVTSNIVLVNPTCGGGACNNIVDNTRGQTITDQAVSVFMNANNSGSVIKSYFPPNALSIMGFTSGSVQLTADATGTGTWTIPSTTDRSVGRATADTLTNKTLNVPFSSGTGLQVFNTTTTCTTAAAVGATCTTANISLPVAEADTNYRVTCTGKGLTQTPVVIATANASASQFTITIAALTANAASFTSYDCVAGHN